MNYERTGHGCGYFHKNGKKVTILKEIYRIFDPPSDRDSGT